MIISEVATSVWADGSRHSAMEGMRRSSGNRNEVDPANDVANERRLNYDDGFLALMNQLQNEVTLRMPSASDASHKSKEKIIYEYQSHSLKLHGPLIRLVESLTSLDNEVEYEMREAIRDDVADMARSIMPLIRLVWSMMEHHHVLKSLSLPVRESLKDVAYTHTFEDVSVKLNLLAVMELVPPTVNVVADFIRAKGPAAPEHLKAMLRELDIHIAASRRYRDAILVPLQLKVQDVMVLGDIGSMVRTFAFSLHNVVSKYLDHNTHRARQIFTMMLERLASSPLRPPFLLEKERIWASITSEYLIEELGTEESQYSYWISNPNTLFKVDTETAQTEKKWVDDISESVSLAWTSNCVISPSVTMTGDSKSSFVRISDVTSGYIQHLVIPGKLLYPLPSRTNT